MDEGITSNPGGFSEVLLGHRCSALPAGAAPPSDRLQDSPPEVSRVIRLFVPPNCPSKTLRFSYLALQNGRGAS